jgi:hypothetical protein
MNNVSKYSVCYYTEHLDDAFCVGSLEDGKAACLDLLRQWMCDELISRSEPDKPTEEEVERWNYMIKTCFVSVTQYDPDRDDYDEVWEPLDEDLSAIGWKEIQ